MFFGPLVSMSPCFEDVLSFFWHMVQHPTLGRTLMGIWGATRGLREGGILHNGALCQGIMGLVLTKGTAMIHGVVKHSGLGGEKRTYKFPLKSFSH